MMLYASSCERPSKSSARVFLPSSVSNSYSFSTGTQGRSRRCLLISSFRSACSASSLASSSRATCHFSRVPILCSGIFISLCRTRTVPHEPIPSSIRTLPGLRNETRRDPETHRNSPRTAARAHGCTVAGEPCGLRRACSRPKLGVRMEPLWSPGVATGGNQGQLAGRCEPRKQAKSVATGCHQLPATFHGKEHVCHRLPPVADNSLLAKEGVDFLASQRDLVPRTRRPAGLVSDVINGVIALLLRESSPSAYLRGVGSVQVAGVGPIGLTPRESWRSIAWKTGAVSGAFKADCVSGSVSGLVDRVRCLGRVGGGRPAAEELQRLLRARTG